jgi:hypothetical protein
VFQFAVANTQLSMCVVGLTCTKPGTSERGQPSKLAQATTHVTSILEVAGSNLDRDTKSPDRGFCWFSSALLAKFRDSAFSLDAVACFLEL